MKYDRQDELLVILPPGDPFGETGGACWRSFFQALSRDWRIFWVHSPVKGERIRVGGAGSDPVTLDSWPAIRRAISEHTVSAVFLVGTQTARECLARLHAFASHMPYIAVLDEDWAAVRDDAVFDGEFTLGLADWLLLTRPELEARLRPLLRRTAVDCTLLPEKLGGRSSSAMAGLASKEIRRLFRRAQARVARSQLALSALVAGSEVASLERRLIEWEACFKGVRERSLWVPDTSLTRRAARRHPAWRWRYYRDRAVAIDGISRSALSTSKPETLLVTGRARVQPLLLDNMAACGRKLPLVAGVGCVAVVEVPKHPQAWASFASAWSLRYRGAYRSVPKLDERCLLLKRAALELVGGFDPRLDWPLAVEDFCLRARQAGLKLFIAEDAVVELPPAPWPDEASRQAFVSKWKLDPLELCAG